MAFRKEGSLPSEVLGTLNYVLHQAFYPDGVHDMDNVYVMGESVFEKFIMDPHIKKTGKRVSAGNWLHGKNLYVLNRSIDHDDQYGPFTMDEIFKMERTTVRNTSECLEYLNQFPGLENLSKDECWQLDIGYIPLPNEFPPEFVRKSIEFAFTNYIPELEDSEGVIIVPGTISRAEEEGDKVKECNAIKIINRDKTKIFFRDGMYIVKIEVAPQKWFILQSCRPASYEKYTSWHVVFKESMELLNQEKILEELTQHITESLCLKK